MDCKKKNGELENVKRIVENRIVLKMEIELKSQRSQLEQNLKSQLQTQLRNSIRIIKKKGS